MGKRKSAAVAVEPNRLLALDKHVYQRWVPSPSKQPQPRPEPRPFVLGAAIQLLQKSLRPCQLEREYFYFSWDQADIPTVLTPAEAHFWLLAMTEACQFHESRLTADDVDSTINKLTSTSFTGKVNLQEILLKIGKARSVSFDQPVQFGLCLLNLFPVHRFVSWLYDLCFSNNAELTQLIDTIQNEEKVSSLDYSRTSQSISAKFLSTLKQVLQVFPTYFWSYRTSDEVEGLKLFLLPLISQLRSLVCREHLFSLAIKLEMYDELLMLVESWTADMFAGDLDFDFFLTPQQIVLSLKQPEAVNFHIRRLQLRLRNDEEVGAWLARTEFSALDYIRDSILPEKTQRVVAAMIAAFGRAKAPEVATYMLELSLDSKNPQAARDWMRKNPEYAIPGLVPLSAADDRLGRAAVKVLRDLKLKGYDAQLQAWIERQPPEVAEQLRATIFEITPSVVQAAVQFDKTTTPEWLKNAIAAQGGTSRTQPPRWLPLEELPPIRVGEVGLNPEQITALLAALKASTLYGSHPLVTAVKVNAQQSSLDAFACKLFERWQQEDMPAREKWVMWAMGLLGSEGAALKLGPLILTWRSEPLKHQRVTWGLDTLKTMGSDTALMQLHSITQKAQYANLRERAAEHLKATATVRGLSLEELEDRIVPDCGLDAQGTKTFDFGSRQFQFVLGLEMKPMVREGKGKLLTNLPKPGAKDDPDLASQAVTAWKLLKKQVDSVTKVQAARLKQAMVNQRRWQRNEFERLVQHPLISCLVQGLVWAGYEEGSDRPITFRIAEDRTYTNVDEEPRILTDIATVGVIHPLHLTPDLRQRWSQLWMDYELIPPFPQLNRELYFPTLEEKEQTVVTRFKDITIPGISLAGTLERQGWLHGGGMWAPGEVNHSKVFSHAGLIVYIAYIGGIYMSNVRHAGDIQISYCSFVPLSSDNSLGQQGLPLGQVEPIVFSEVMRDLTNLTAKATR